MLAEPGAAPNAWKKFQDNGFLNGATVGNASELMTGKCVPSAAPARFPDLRVRVRPFKPTRPLVLLGHVDGVTQCAKTITVVGWAPFTGAKETLDVWAEGPVKVVRAVRQERPDVVAQPGNSGLQSPGYMLILRMLPAQKDQICLSLNGAGGSILGGSRAQGCSGS